MMKTRPRKQDPNCIVIHWTGGENPPSTVLNTLERRGLSTHYVIDVDGSVHQFVDPAESVALHAGEANETSIGIEVVCFGFRKNPIVIPKKGARRMLISEKVNWTNIDSAQFYFPQFKAVTDLICCLVNRFPTIPKKFPFQEGREIIPHAVPNGDWKGVIGHFHIKKAKKDPGLFNLQVIADMVCQRRWK